MIAHPGLPQIRTCGIIASGSSGNTFASPERYLPSLRERAIGVRCLQHVSLRQCCYLVRPFPPPDFRVREFPGVKRYYGARRLPEAPLAALGCLRAAIRAFALLSRPRRTRRIRPMAMRRCGPRRVHDEGVRVEAFEAPLHGFSTRCGHRAKHGRLRRAGYPATTQDSLPAAGQALPGGTGYPRRRVGR